MTITLMNIQANGTIHYSGLHQDMLVYRAGRKSIEIHESRGMWIGMLDDIQGLLAVDLLSLDFGDILLLYTDGITEALAADQKMYGEDKLQNILLKNSSLNAESLKSAILESLKNYSCPDDVTFMIIKRVKSA
jgi:serine phosphatase RsbU (regulator of sigma subunit)